MGVTNAAKAAAKAAGGAGDRSASIRRLMGARASQATGADIPRPRPAPLKPEVPARISPEAVDGLLRKVEQGGLDSLSENELALLRQSTAMPATPLASPDITITAPTADDINLSSSATDLGGPAPARPPKSPEELAALANEIRQLTGGSSRGEAISVRQARATQKKIASLSGEDMQSLVGVMGNEDDAMSRLEQVQNIAGDAARDPKYAAASAIDAAAQARAGTMRPQGALAPEFDTGALTDAELPTAADTARAAERERQETVAARAPGGGMSREERLSLAGLDPNNKQAMRDAPMWLKGADDRPSNPLEDRTHAGRLAKKPTTADIANVDQAEELKAAVAQAQGELRDAQYEHRLSQIGLTSGRGQTTHADVAAAEEKVRASQDVLGRLYRMEDDFFPPRLVGRADGVPLRDAAGKLRTATAAMLDDPSLVPKGIRLERGVRAVTDSWLNRAGTQQTYNDLVLAGAGMRPRGARSLNRSTPAMSAYDKRALADEAEGAFGSDGIEMLPEEQELDDVSDLGETGKPKKVRGRPQPSREMGAVDQMFREGENPLVTVAGIEVYENPALRRTAARGVAEEILAKQTTGMVPGTPNYQMALERWAKLIEDKFGSAPVPATSAVPAEPGVGMAVNTTQDPANIPREGVRDMRGLGRGIPNQRSVSPTAAPEGDLPPLQPGRKQPEPPASVDEQQLEASAVNIPPVEGDIDGLAPTAPAPSKGKGGRKGGKGEPSAKGESLPPVEGDWDALPDAEKNKAFEDFAATYGEPPAPDNAQFVEDARKHWESKNKPAAAAKAKPTPAAGGAGGSGKKPPPPDAPDKLPPVEGDDAAKADASKPKKDASPDAEKPKSDTSKPAAPETPEKKRFWDRYRVAGAGLLATGVVDLLARLGRQADGNGPSPADDPASQPPGSSRRPVPPGGPVGDVLGGPNADISATDLDRAIDRLRTARSGTGARTQVLQNW